MYPRYLEMQGFVFIQNTSFPKFPSLERAGTSLIGNLSREMDPL